MINITYTGGWDASLRHFSDNKQLQDIKLTTEKDNILSWAGLKNAAENNDVEKHKFIQRVLSLEPEKNGAQVHLIAMLLIDKILHNFDQTDSLHGLMNALFEVDKRISPFHAASNYCIKINAISTAGVVDFTISPIYHLGPEYIDEYKVKHGTEIDREAILGLIELPADNLEKSDHTKFKLGIDAGIVFKDSKIPHNKDMQLKLEIIDTGIVASLTCDSQTMSKAYTWFEMGVDGDYNHHAHAMLSQQESESAGAA